MIVKGADLPPPEARIHAQTGVLILPVSHVRALIEKRAEQQNVPCCIAFQFELWGPLVLLLYSVQSSRKIRAQWR